MVKEINNLNQRFKGWALVSMALLGALVLIALGVGFVFPLQLQEYSSRYELWKAGVVSVHTQEGWHGYLVDQCGPHPEHGCSCVALIHGMADTGMTWKKILLWPQARWGKMGLDHPIKLFAVDLPGSGQTPAPQNQEDYRVRKQAEKLHQVLEPLCSQWAVVGNSMGGWIAAWLGLDWPEGVKRLVLLDSAGLKSAAVYGKTLLAEPTIESMKEFQKKAYYHPREIPDWQWKVIVDRIKSMHSDQLSSAQIEDDFLDTKLSVIKKPILLMWGKADQIIPIEVGKQMRDLVPGAIWREVSECGHLPQKECPLAVIQGIIDMLHYGAM